MTGLGLGQGFAQGGRQSFETGKFGWLWRPARIDAINPADFGASPKILKIPSLAYDCLGCCSRLQPLATVVGFTDRRTMIKLSRIVAEEITSLPALRVLRMPQTLRVFCRFSGKNHFKISALRLHKCKRSCIEQD